MRHATNKALTQAVPEIFWQAGGDARLPVYTPTDHSRAILESLHRRYGILKTVEKLEAVEKWKKHGIHRTRNVGFSENENQLFK